MRTGLVSGFSAAIDGSFPAHGANPGHRNPANHLQAAVEALADGRLVVLIDSRSHPTQGYLVQAAEHATDISINQMVRLGGGLLCVALSEARLDQLGLRSQRVGGTGVDFAITVEAQTGVTTGISAADRARTVKVLGTRNAGPDDLVSPGHVVPVRARWAGDPNRPDWPAAAARLVTLAGYEAAAAVCHILDEAGEPADYREAIRAAKEHGLAAVTTADVLETWQPDRCLVERAGQVEVSLADRRFLLTTYDEVRDPLRHQALVLGDVASHDPVPLRIHHQDPLWDVIDESGSRAELLASVQAIAERDLGILLYMAAGKADPAYQRGQLPYIVAEILADLGVNVILRDPIP